MKKEIRTLAALLIASATFVACSSDDNIIEEPQQPATTGKYTMTINASKGDAATTRALSLDDNTLNATWATTEDVYVQKGTDWATGSLKPQDNAATTTLKGELSGITINPADELTLQFPRSGEKDYTGQVGTLADIAEKYDYATATVTVASVSDGNITTADNAVFENQQAIVKFTLIDKADGTTPLSASELVVSDGTNSYTVTPASATSELYVAIPGFSEQTITLDASVGGKLYTYSKNSVTFTNGQYYEIAVKMSAVPGTLAGLFTINASGNQVRFSQGNLQATTTDLGSNWTWSFAANQYDLIGNAAANTRINGNGTVSDNGTVDLFGWSTGVTYFGIHSSMGRDDYSGDFVDWGTNAISNGGNTANQWRTLTKDEWEYLFNTRTASTVNGTSNARFAKAYLFGNKHGIILFPDNYTHPSDVTAPTGINATDATSYDGNKYTAEQWAKMEAAGAVFLPSAGFRGGSSFTSTPHGYWSSTNYGDMGRAAYYLYFNPNNLSVTDMSRYYGYSVRLVKDAN